jgi:glycosyltransferase involved in cell wall biosynthesis
MSSLPKSDLSADPWNISYSLKETTSSNEPKLPSVCLNMIVKNEEKIIERLLASVDPFIDSYCICDTGSTDYTIDVIETFFRSKNKPGKVVQEPFKDFGYNRTFALNACTDMDRADYILLLDADMIFSVDPALTPRDFRTMLLKADVHYIFQGTNAFYYKNTRIVRNCMGCTYWGVTHEYVNCPPNTIYNQIEKSSVFIRDIGDGGSKADKFDRDIRLLKQGLVDLPNNDRYTFYLANSLRDFGKTEEAIETYRKRIEIGGWIEEVWYSYFSIGNCYKRLGDMANAIHAWMDGYQHYPERLEGLFEIIHYYRCLGKNRIAYPYYMLAKNELDKKHKLEYLFMQKDVYEYKLDYEMTIIGYYCNTDGHDLAKLSMQVMTCPSLDEITFKNIYSNYKFYAKAIKSIATSPLDRSMAQLIDLMRTVGRSKMEGQTDFVASTPSLLKISPTKYVVNVRYVNYSIGEQGEYIQRSKIETQNILAILEKTDDAWTITSEVFLQHDPTADDFYVGIEDVRLFQNMHHPSEKNTITYNGNRCLKSGSMEIEVGRVNTTTGETQPPQYPHIPNQGPLEKNWVFLDHDQDPKQKMIYGWSPLTIGTLQHASNIVDEKEKETTSASGTVFHTTHRIDTPAIFKHLRGSTNGLTIGQEIWFICHSVSYEDRRYYYHTVVVLDSTTLQVKRYTPFFTFEGEKVEYTLGFTYQEEDDTFLIGYSVMDRRNDYMVIARNLFEGSMISCLTEQ